MQNARAGQYENELSELIRQSKDENPLNLLAKFSHSRTKVTFEKVEKLIVMARDLYEQRLNAGDDEGADRVNDIEFELGIVKQLLNSRSKSLIRSINRLAPIYYDEFQVKVYVTGDERKNQDDRIDEIIQSLIHKLVYSTCQMMSQTQDYLNIKLVQTESTIEVDLIDLPSVVVERLQQSMLPEVIAKSAEDHNTVSELIYGDKHIKMTLSKVGGLRLTQQYQLPESPDLVLRYKSQKGEVLSRGVTPLKIEHKNGHHILLAHCHRRDDLRRFILDSVVGEFICTKTGKPVDMQAVARLCLSVNDEFAG